MEKFVSKAIDDNKNELVELSSAIWNNPELGWEEYQAHELLTGFLEKNGFNVERSYTGIKTAFRAKYGSGRPNVCVISEYDALPEIGHACGHNLIAEAGIAAGLGLKAAIEQGGLQGCVTVMGTPAEEGGGGKVKLMENGAFKDIDVAMMVHPFPDTLVKPIYNARKTVAIKFTGKAAHAAAFPWEGVNALDAAVLTYNAVSVLRQQIKPSWRVHSIITNGGVKSNIIPESSSMEMTFRAPCVKELAILDEKICCCYNAAAQATGCSVETMQQGCTYLDVQQNEMLADSFGRHLGCLGVSYKEIGDVNASTDMGNVSYMVPSLHPNYAIGSGEVNHTRAFTAVANTPEAHHKTLLAAKAMAYTGVDVITKEGFLDKIKDNFKKL